MTVINVLERGPIARYNPTSGLMLVSTSLDAVHKITTKNTLDVSEFEYVVAYKHEIVHHLQTLSSAFLWLSSLGITQATIQAFRASDSAAQSQCLATIARLNRARGLRAYGVSVIDLCEGAAVLESYKACAASPSLAGYYKYREYYFPGKGNSVYRRTFDIMAEALGAAVTYDLLSIVTLISLQGAIPGLNFEVLLNTKTEEWDRLVGVPAREVVKTLGWELGFIGGLSAMEQTELHPSQRHPVLYPALAYMKNRYSGDLFEVMARPGPALRSPVSHIFFPPVIVGTHLLGKPITLCNGIALDSPSIRESVTFINALTTAFQRITSSSPNRSSWQPCPHVDCSCHTKCVCSGVVPAPSAPSVCYFRNSVRDSVGRELHDVISDCEAAVDESVKAISISDELDAVFPDFTPASNIDPASTHAERFDAKYMLDPQDNDAEVMVPCESCCNVFPVRSSLRYARNGFQVACPNCGTPHYFDIEDAVTINFDR